MNEQHFNPVFFEQEDPKNIKSIEVCTNTEDVIGPDNDAEALEAIPVTCAILTITLSQDATAGMAHYSLGLQFEGVEMLTDEFISVMKKHGVFTQQNIRLFNADEILTQEIDVALNRHNLKSPEPERIPMGKNGVRVNKNTGEVTFFTVNP